MNPEARYILHPEVVIREGTGGGEFLILKRGARIGGRGVDAALHELLCEFRSASPILDAVERHASKESAEPEEVLTEAWGALWRLINAGVLVDADREWRPLRQRLRVGDEHMGVRVVECLRVMEDFQVYRGEFSDGRQAALKLAPAGHKGAVDLLRREASLLERLDGVVTPTFAGFSEEDGATLVSGWCRGVPLARWLRGPRADRHVVGSRIARAYSRLHALGVLHVDVNLNNVVIGDDDVRILDFAGSVLVEAPRASPRLGVLGFQEPEYLAALEAARPTGDPSETGEQYGVACLLYHVFTGNPPLRQQADREPTVRAILEQPARRFSDHGIFDLPSVEAVILRGLSRDPGARFPSVGVLADELDVAIAASPARLELGDGLTERLTRALSPGGPWHGDGFPGRPRCSINSGSGGVTLALLEVAIVRDDDRLLRLAEAWHARTREWARRSEAFKVEEFPRVSEIVDDGVSFLHTDLGLSWLEVLLEEARGDVARRDRAVARLIRRAGRAGTLCDLALGRTGNLAVAASVLGRTGAQAIRAFGHTLVSELEMRMARFGPISRQHGPTMNLGMAHGWAGLIWAAALWSRASGDPVPMWVIDRARELVSHAVPRGATGLAWPWWSGSKDSFALGWCNGAAGFVLAFCEMASATGEVEWLKVAERAGYPLEGARWGAGHLCCGAAGAVFAASRLFQVTGDPRWLGATVRTRDEALRRAGSQESAASLFRGDVGILLVDVEVSDLRGLTFPGFW